MAAVTFGSASVSNNRITQPLTLASEMLYVDASAFAVAATSGDLSGAIVTIEDVFRRTGANSDKRKYNLFIDIPDNVNGVLTITPNGATTKVDGTREALSGSATSLNFETRIPFVDYVNPPASLADNTAFTFIFGWNVQVVGLGVDDFLYTGNPGTPTLYRSTYTGAVSGLPAFSTSSAQWVADSTGNSVTAAKYMALHFAALTTAPQHLEIYVKPNSVRVYYAPGT